MKLVFFASVFLCMWSFAIAQDNFIPYIISDEVEEAVYNYITDSNRNIPQDFYIILHESDTINKLYIYDNQVNSHGVIKKLINLTNRKLLVKDIWIPITLGTDFRYWAINRNYDYGQFGKRFIEPMPSVWRISLTGEPYVIEFNIKGAVLKQGYY